MKGKDLKFLVGMIPVTRCTRTRTVTGFGTTNQSHLYYDKHLLY